ncbi:MAG: SRPBCC family protein [Bacteroidetes bacterium]|nr:SRPBCC family protein [Bacteroidota bacterium]
MNNSQLTVEANIQADIQTVWSAYTAPEHITKWNFATDDWQCPHAENDLRVGGRYLARMEAKDGSFGFDFEATYDEVSPVSKLVYTMTDGRKCSVTFSYENNQTKVVTTFDAESENPPEMQQQGWQMILNNFKKYAETL